MKTTKVYEGVVIFTNDMDWAVVNIEERDKTQSQTTSRLPEGINWREYEHKYVRVKLQVKVLKKKFTVTTKERKHDTDPNLITTDINIKFEEFKQV